MWIETGRHGDQSRNPARHNAIGATEGGQAEDFAVGDCGQHRCGYGAAVHGDEAGEQIQPRNDVRFGPGTAEAIPVDQIGGVLTAYVRGHALGREYDGPLWIGSSRPFAPTGVTGGSLYRLRLSSSRLSVNTSADPRLADKVADNLNKFEPTESETLLIGRGFGVTPSIEQGPDGNLYVVSITDGVVYRISRATATTSRSK